MIFNGIAALDLEGASPSPAVIGYSRHEVKFLNKHDTDCREDADGKLWLDDFVYRAVLMGGCVPKKFEVFDDDSGVPNAVVSTDRGEFSMGATNALLLSSLLGVDYFVDSEYAELQRRGING